MLFATKQHVECRQEVVENDSVKHFDLEDPADIEAEVPMVVPTIDLEKKNKMKRGLNKIPLEIEVEGTAALNARSPPSRTSPSTWSVEKVVSWMVAVEPTVARLVGLEFISESCVTVL